VTPTTPRPPRRAPVTGPFKRARGEEGFTFIEAIIVIGILPVVMAAITGVFVVGLKVIGTGSRSNAGIVLGQSHDRQLIQAYFPQDVESAGPVCPSTCTNSTGVLYAGQPTTSLNGATCVTSFSNGQTFGVDEQLVLALTWQGTPTITDQTVGPPSTTTDTYEADYVIQTSAGTALSTTGTPVGLPPAASPVSNTPTVELHRYYCDHGNSANNINTVIARSLNNGWNVSTLTACPPFSTYAPAWAAAAGGAVTLNLTDNSCTAYSITAEEHS